MNQHPMFTIRCADCGMPVAEGPLFTAEGETYCEIHLPDHTEQVCDFCKTSHPVWKYDGADEGMEALIGETSVILSGAWAACDDCCLAIEKHDVGYLIQAAVGDVMHNLPHEEEVRQVMMVYFTFVLGSLKHPPTMIKEEL